MKKENMRFKLDDFSPKDTFYRVPKQLLKNEMYVNLSTDAILMYAIFQDRFELSLMNRWVDNNNDVYFYFSLDEIQKLLNKSKTTIIKIKKELAKFSLLEEVQQGLHKTNRLYLLKPEALDNKGITDSGIPKSVILEVQKLDTNDTEYNYTKDINDTNSDTSKELAEIFLANSSEILETKLVSKNTVRLFSFFGDLHVAKKFVDIIYLAKKKVENFEHKENPKNLRTSLTGEWWKVVIEKKAKDFIFKMKEYIQKDKPIRDLEKYWFQVMETFWEDVLLMEKKYDYSVLREWFEDGVLELEEESSESRTNSNKLSRKEKKMRRYDDVYKTKFMVIY